MCARFYLEEDERLLPLIEEMNRSPLMALAPRDKSPWGERTPGSVAPAVAAARSGEKKTFPMQWGFEGRSLLINARAESAAEKPSFADAWMRRRCAVPASWYFEWEHVTGPDGKRRVGNRWRFQPGSGDIAWLCGLYRLTEGLPRFVILTREAAQGVRFVHDRMPLILPPEAVPAWISRDVKPEDLLPRAVTDIRYERDPR